MSPDLTTFFFKKKFSLVTRIVSKLKIFLRRDVWLPLLIFEVITLLQQFSGLSSISYYAVSVFVQSGSAIDEVSQGQLGPRTIAPI